MSAVPPPDAAGFAFDRFRQELDKWWETARNEGQKAFSAVGLHQLLRPERCPLDVVETEQTVEIWIDLPGVSAEQVQLSLTGNLLTLEATRTISYPEGRVQLQERLQGPILRSLPLPAAIQADSATAESREGILHITLKKAPPSGARQIPIQFGKPMV